ncbi:MAG: hypothetical protein WC600_08695 [Desulfobaccales bacterium]
MPRIFRRLLPAGPDWRLSRTEEDQGPLYRRKKPQEPQRARSSSEASLDLNHLTEQVIQAIDRRIAAQRERLGRP